MLALGHASAPKVWMDLTGINQSINILLGVGIAKVLEVSPTPLEYATDDKDDVATDASYRTPPMASTSPATIPPEAMVEVPTPQVSCVCGEIVAESDNGKELMLYTEDDGFGDVVPDSESEEEHFPEENIDPLPVRAPPAYAPVCGQRAVHGCSSCSFCPYRFPYAERVDRRLHRKASLGEIADSAHRRFKWKWGGEDLA